MLTIDSFETSFNLLAVALNWSISNSQKLALYKRLTVNWEDEEFADQAMEFCDRGEGTIAEFMHSLRMYRKQTQTAPVHRALPEAAASPLVESQLKVFKLMALMANGLSSRFEEITLTEDDIEIGLKHHCRDSIIAALQAHYSDKARRLTGFRADIIAALA